ELDLEYQYRFRTEEHLIEASTIKNGIDLTRSFFDRPPFARLLLQGTTSFGFGAIGEIALRDQWTGDYFRTDNLPVIGVGGDPVRFENFFITKAEVYYDSPFFDFHFGREKPDYNGILYGGLLPGTRLPYLDAVKASGKLGRMKIDWMVATIPALESWDGEDVDPNKGTLPTGSTYYGFESEPYSTNSSPTTIVEGMNRFSWDFGRVSLGVTDHAMMARRNNRFYITDFIPVISRHQAAVSQTNNSMVFDIGWEPLDGLRLATQAGFDDINASFLGVGDTSSPTIDAYVAGLDYGSPTALGPLKIKAEAGYTHWLWGNYDGSEIWPNDQNPFLRFQYRYLSDSGGLLLPLSSPYGPGAIWASLSGSLQLNGLGLELGMDFLYLSKNDEANLIDTQVLDNTTTAGAHRTQFISFALPLRWRAGFWEFSIKPELAVLDGDPWFELWFGSAFRLR
ncbi:MAG TPA: hypothetical protein VN437_08485, partial [Rectinemataceae bacterium]|nr:hypothetical protein [Rectinemataceae bacterium]